MYQIFLDWAETQGFTFPCTPAQFHRYAVAYASTFYTRAAEDSVVDYICSKGLGPNWADN